MDCRYTQTGKVARKALQCLLAGVLPARDALKNPAALDDLRAGVVARWRLHQSNRSLGLDASEPWKKYIKCGHGVGCLPLLPHFFAHRQGAC